MIRGYGLRDVFTADELDLMREHLRCWDETSGRPRPKGGKPWTTAEREYVAELYDRARSHGFLPYKAHGFGGFLQAVNRDGHDDEYLPGWRRVRREKGRPGERRRR